MSAPDIETFQTLADDCGHHCGVTTSSDIRTIGHCSCAECHDRPTAPIVSARVTGTAASP